jgi:hypothetical protein
MLVDEAVAVTDDEHQTLIGRASGESIRSTGEG